MSRAFAFVWVKSLRFAAVLLGMTGIGAAPAAVSAGTDTVHLTAPHQQTGSAQL